MTSDEAMGASRHVSAWIEATPEAVYDFASDPEGLRRWAAGLADPALGAAEVQFVPRNDVGVLDHLVTLPSGERFYNPMRVIPGGPDERRCEVVFTLRRQPGVTDEEFEVDAAAVAADLQTLRGILENAEGVGSPG